MKSLKIIYTLTPEDLQFLLDNQNIYLDLYFMMLLLLSKQESLFDK